MLPEISELLIEPSGLILKPSKLLPERSELILEGFRIATNNLMTSYIRSFRTDTRLTRATSRRSKTATMLLRLLPIA